MSLTRAELRTLDREELTRHACRLSLLEFYLATHPGFHGDRFHRRICTRLERFLGRIERREAPNLILEAPPQHGKSTVTSRAFPGWVLGKHPDWPIILASYASTLAAGHGRWIRNTASTSRFTSVFPGVSLAEDSQAKDFFHTNHGGQFYSIGVDGGASGQPARLLILDDPYKDMGAADSPTVRATVESWWESVAMARLADGGGKLIMTTRWRLDDIVGFVQQRARENPAADQWEVLSFQALAEDDEYDDDGGLFRLKGEALSPNVHSVGDLERRRAGMSSRNWLAMYQQKPVPDGGGYFQKNWFRTYATVPRLGEKYLAADLAVRTGQDNDYSPVGAFGETEASELTWAEIQHGRRDSLASVELIIDMAERHQAGVLFIGRDMITGSLGPLIRRRMEERKVWFKIEEVPERKDLEQRARSYQGRLQQGKVLYPAGLLFNEVILPEHLLFSGGPHDDLIAMASNACYGLELMQSARPIKQEKPANPDIARWKARSAWQKGNGEKQTIAPLFGG